MSAPVLSVRSGEAVERAVRHLQAGELVIIPTDTIYGIAAYPALHSIELLARVRDRRTPEPALPFLLARTQHLSRLTHPSPVVRRLAHRFWPGSLTLIVQPLPTLASALRPIPVAVRVPNYPDLIPLLEMAGGYLVVSGAIRSGHSPAITAQEAAGFFGEDVALILDGGRSPYGVPSTIVDCTAIPPAIVRRGAIHDEDLLEHLSLRE